MYVMAPLGQAEPSVLLITVTMPTRTTRDFLRYTKGSAVAGQGRNQCCSTVDQLKGFAESPWPKQMILLQLAEQIPEGGAISAPFTSILWCTAPFVTRGWFF